MRETFQIITHTEKLKCSNWEQCFVLIMKGVVILTLMGVLMKHLIVMMKAKTITDGA